MHMLSYHKLGLVVSMLLCFLLLYLYQAKKILSNLTVSVLLICASGIGGVGRITDGGGNFFNVRGAIRTGENFVPKLYVRRAGGVVGVKIL